MNTQDTSILTRWSLSSGSHAENNRGELCAMEMVAYLAREPWSDAPACTCPVIGAFVRSWNDALPCDADRDRLLKPLLLQLIGTRSTPEIAGRRSYMALDWLIRVHTPKWLDLRPELAAHATTLRDLDEIADMAGAKAAGERVRAARAAARDAARAAAWAAARDAAWAAAGDAAWAAAGAAARDAAWAAAGAAAGDAAGDAARAAAWAAAWDAAGDALTPTTEWLQISATDLLNRMIAVRP